MFWKKKSRSVVKSGGEFVGFFAKPAYQEDQDTPPTLNGGGDSSGDEMEVNTKSRKKKVVSPRPKHSRSASEYDRGAPLKQNMFINSSVSDLKVQKEEAPPPPPMPALDELPDAPSDSPYCDPPAAPSDDEEPDSPPPPPPPQSSLDVRPLGLQQTVDDARSIQVSVGAGLIGDNPVLFTWGCGQNGQLGYKSSSKTAESPAEVQVGKREVLDHVYASSTGAIAVTKKGIAYLWGSGAQLRDIRGPSMATSPTVIGHNIFREKVSHIACGENHTLVLSTTQTVYSWGDGLLSGHVQDAWVPTPTPILALDDDPVLAIDCGPYHSMLSTADSDVYSWGRAGPWLGRGNAEVSHRIAMTPKKIIGFKQRIAIFACGASHTLMLTYSGEVYVCGLGKHGRLGLGHESAVDSPRKLGLLNENGDYVIQVSAGASHSAACSRSGRLYTWGSNSCGQLGLGNHVDMSNVPVSVFPEPTSIFKSVACADESTFALTFSGLVWSMGVTSDFNDRELRPHILSRFRKRFVFQIAAGANFAVALCAPTKRTDSAYESEEQSYIDSLAKSSLQNAFHTEDETDIITIKILLNRVCIGELSYYKEDMDELTGEVLREGIEESIANRPSSYRFLCKGEPIEKGEEVVMGLISLMNDDNEIEIEEAKKARKVKIFFKFEDDEEPLGYIKIERGALGTMTLAEFRQKLIRQVNEECLPRTFVILDSIGEINSGMEKKITLKEYGTLVILREESLSPSNFPMSRTVNVVSTQEQKQLELFVYLEGNSSPLGVLDIENAPETTLSDVRQLILAEISSVASIPSSYIFLWSLGAPVSPAQESKKTIDRLQNVRQDGIIIRKRD